MNSTLSNIWIRFQAKSEAFPHTEEVGPLPKYHNHLVQVRDLTGVGGLVDTYRRSPGRPQQSRRALTQAFIAKAIRDLLTNRDPIGRLKVDAPSRRLCGWLHVNTVPSDATRCRTKVQAERKATPEFAMRCSGLAGFPMDALPGDDGGPPRTRGTHRDDCIVQKAHTKGDVVRHLGVSEGTARYHDQRIRSGAVDGRSLQKAWRRILPRRSPTGGCFKVTVRPTRRRFIAG